MLVHIYVKYASKCLNNSPFLLFALIYFVKGEDYKKPDRKKTITNNLNFRGKYHNTIL